MLGPPSSSFVSVGRHRRLIGVVLASSTAMLAADISLLYELPDELLLAYIDGSMRLAVTLAQTNIVLGARIHHVARRARGLRMVCSYTCQAICHGCEEDPPSNVTMYVTVYPA